MQFGDTADCKSALRNSSNSFLVSFPGRWQRNGDMKAETLRRLIEANPFQPFSVNLADGRALRVPHRDFISPSPNFRMLTVWHEDDSADLIDFMLVPGFHVGRRQRNGHRRRKSSG
jgi:hypothetical protein